MAALGSHDDSHLIFIYANHLRSGARDMDHAYTMSFPDYGYVVLLKGGHESIAQLGKPISENQYRNKSEY